MEIIQAGGVGSWWSLLARPMSALGILGMVQRDKHLSRRMHWPALWPGEGSFELLDFDDEGELSFRVRAHLAKGEAGAVRWADLARLLMNSEDNSLSRFFEESRPDGTWRT